MKNKYAAVLIAWFCGFAGFHKFYLGENLAGLIYLLFFWTGIPAIIAFFECIGYLIMSEQAFNAKYNPGLLQAPTNNYPSHVDKVNAISKLKELYDSGVITAEEFEEKRRKILDSI